jgi:hypothetical protein
MTRRSAHSLLLSVFLLGASLPAQGIDRRLVERLEPETRRAVAAIIDSARTTGLPTEPLIEKALEGASKKAPNATIVSAVRNFAIQLGQARRALGTGSTPAEVLSGAQAIRAGISLEQLERLRKSRPNVQIATALTVASDLVAREVPVDTAISIVSGLLRASATDEQLLAVRADIETDILTGKPPAVAASARGQALEQTLAEMPPNGAGQPGTLPSPSGTNRAGDNTGPLNPPAQARGVRSPAEAPAKPPVSQRKQRP